MSYRKRKCASLDCPEPDKLKETTPVNVEKGFSGKDKGIAHLCEICLLMCQKYKIRITFNKHRIKQVNVVQS